MYSVIDIAVQVLVSRLQAVTCNATDEIIIYFSRIFLLFYRSCMYCFIASKAKIKKKQQEPVVFFKKKRLRRNQSFVSRFSHMIHSSIPISISKVKAIWFRNFLMDINFQWKLKFDYKFACYLKKKKKIETFFFLIFSIVSCF